MSNQYAPPIAFHPGETLREKLQEIDMAVENFASKTGYTKMVILEIINGKMDITQEMAIRFESILLIPAHIWNKKQYKYDEYIKTL